MALRHFLTLTSSRIVAGLSSCALAVCTLTVQAAEPIAPRDGAAPTVEARVRARLAAGEFGPALNEIRQLESSDQRTRLLQSVADAQMQVGDFDSAYYSIRQMPDSDYRGGAVREHRQNDDLAGGMIIADPTMLMNLIQFTVPEGNWNEDQGQNDPDVGDMQWEPTGVAVDPNGLMRNLTQLEKDGQLQALGINARQAALNGDLSRPSALRLVSLTRLEREVARLTAEGRPVVRSMKYLAGISKIQYVFVYPEEGEIVIGGPAEPWRYDDEGRPVGVSNGRPMLQLDDFVTVFRTFSPDGAGYFNCLIVPREEGLKAVREFVDSSNSPLQPGRVTAWTKELQDRLGLQDIVVNGIPEDSRVARVIVEADYQMKLIGVGKHSPVRSIPSFFELLAETREENLSSVDALRWWMTMKYDAIAHSPNREAFEIKGSSVLCQSENEFVTAQGQRVPTRKAEQTNSLFAANFTQNYEELAKVDPVFADLQNIFDLSLVAALIRNERLDARTDWDGGAFAHGSGYETRRHPAPKTVMSIVNHKVYNRRNIVVQVAGGVKGDVLNLVRNEELRENSEQLTQLEQTAAAPSLPAGRWWWDAK
jgi:hypothetical protein